MVAEGTGAEPSISWARYQVAVTKYKESEKHSSSMYASYDGEDPVVDFQSFIEDDEVIEDEVIYLHTVLHKSQLLIQSIRRVVIAYICSYFLHTQL